MVVCGGGGWGYWGEGVESFDSSRGWEFAVSIGRRMRGFGRWVGVRIVGAIFVEEPDFIKLAE